MNKIDKGPQEDATYQQEGQDGPGSLTLISERTLAQFFFFFSLSENDLQEFLHVRIVQEVPIHQNHVYAQIKILRTIVLKVHPRNIPMKLFQF